MAEKSDMERQIEKQISVLLPKNLELVEAQDLIDAHLVNMPRRGFSLHIQFKRDEATTA